MSKLAQLVRDKPGYVIAFALGAIVNSLLGNMHGPEIPWWITWSLPFALFVVFWIILMISTKRKEK